LRLSLDDEGFPDLCVMGDRTVPFSSGRTLLNASFKTSVR
jgi:hypothetical protein